MQWLDARCHEIQNCDTLQPMYGISGEHKLTEQTLDHLEGYRKARPVRIGNGAYTQKQLDIYGEFLDAVAIYNRYDAIAYDLWQNIHRLLEWLSQHWQDPDEGIWEVRDGPKQFLHSRLMSWVAFDRAIRVMRQRGWPAPSEKWVQFRSQIYQQIMTEGWNEHKQSFVQWLPEITLEHMRIGPCVVTLHFWRAGDDASRWEVVEIKVDQGTAPEDQIQVSKEFL